VAAPNRRGPRLRVAVARPSAPPQYPAQRAGESIADERRPARAAGSIGEEYGARA